MTRIGGPGPHPRPHVVRRGSGPPILFVHGNGVDHRALLELDDCFAGAGERVYVDLPGFGRTPALSSDEAGVPELAEWLDAYVDVTFGSTPFLVVGQSLGGLLARDLVARRPDQVVGMALIAPGVRLRPRDRRLPPRVVLSDAGDLPSGNPEADLADYLDMAVEVSAENYDSFARSTLPGIRAADETAMMRLARRYFLPETPESGLESWGSPGLIITGRQDHVVGYLDQAELLETYTRTELHVLDGAGHNVHLDRPLEVQRLLRGWVSRVQASGTWTADSAPEAAVAPSGSAASSLSTEVSAATMPPTAVEDRDERGRRLPQWSPRRVVDPYDIVANAHIFDHPVTSGSAESFLRRAGHVLFFVDEPDGEGSTEGVPPRAIGFVSGVEMQHPDAAPEMFLHELGVEPVWQRHGVGAALLEAIEDEARTRGCTGVWTGTGRTNLAAQATYRKAGFGIDADSVFVVLDDLDRS